jgi:hypothetical protein
VHLPTPEATPEDGGSSAPAEAGAVDSVPPPPPPVQQRPSTPPEEDDDPQGSFAEILGGVERVVRVEKKRKVRRADGAEALR